MKVINQRMHERWDKFKPYLRIRGTKPRGDNLLTGDIIVREPKMMRAICRKLINMAKKDEELKKMYLNGQLSSIHRNFESLYISILHKGDNMIN